MSTPSEYRLRAVLSAWGDDFAIRGRLAGGARNEAWGLELGSRRYAARLGRRSPEALEWEARLLQSLRAADLLVPEVLPTRDGRLHSDGLLVLSWLDGETPKSERDWRRVASELQHLHELTRGWEQRPGFLSTRDLLTGDSGGDVRLDLMPEEAVVRVREAWAVLDGEPLSVVHGYPGPGNILMQVGRVGFIDWDEARVDVSLLDLASLPLDLSSELGSERLGRTRRAATAWEAANGWLLEPEYARRQLAEL